VEIEPFSIALSRPLGTAAGAIETRCGFLVRVDIEGTPGLGEATPLPGWTESLEECEEALRSIDDPVSALADGRLADTPAARHAVSLATLDARAQNVGRPLYRYLGGDGRVGSVPVNATVGDGTPEATADAVEDAVREGYPAVKLKVGSRDPEVDIDRVAAARSTAPDVEIRLDANGAWSEATAERLLTELADYGVSILEQPLSADALEAHQRLRGRGVDIALDEGVVERGFDAILGANAADILVCKPMALGGIDIARNVVRSARIAGADAVVTTTIDGAVARAGAVHLVASLPGMQPCGLATGGLLETDLRAGIAPIADGAVVVPQGKGNIPPR
jgi:o-succinylbenzoate synthase